MKKCWDHNPKNRPTALEIWYCLRECHRNDRTEKKKEIIELAEAKRQEIIKSEKFLSDTKNYKHHLESEQAEPLLNFSSAEIGSKIHHIDDDDGDDNCSVKKKLKIIHK